MARAVNSVLGSLLLAALALALAGAAGMVVLDAAGESDPAVPLELEASVTVGDHSARVLLLHVAGPTVDVREVRLHVTVDGVPIEHQPSVPFYSASGFGSFPSGPFNPAADPRWEPGERAALEMTGENFEQVSRGATVGVELYRDDLPIASVETTAG